jgi:hypothetical protein
VPESMDGSLYSFLVLISNALWYSVMRYPFSEEWTDINSDRLLGYLTAAFNCFQLVVGLHIGSIRIPYSLHLQILYKLLTYIFIVYLSGRSVGGYISLAD